jgi:hypothetical protein
MVVPVANLISKRLYKVLTQLLPNAIVYEQFLHPDLFWGLFLLPYVGGGAKRGRRMEREEGGGRRKEGILGVI